MFCTKCGKKIDYEAAVCNECAGVGQWFNAETQPTPNANTEQEIKVNNDINNNINDQNLNNNNGFYNDPNANPYNNQNYNAQYNQGYNNQYNQGYNQNYNTTYTQGYTTPTTTQAPAKPQGSRKAGLSGAITSAVLSTIGFSIAYAAFFIAEMATLDYSEEAIAAAIISVPFAIAGLIMSIIGLIKGTGAIKVFKSSSPKPIATLIVGIEGAASGAGGILMAASSFLMCFAAMLSSL